MLHLCPFSSSAALLTCSPFFASPELILVICFFFLGNERLLLHYLATRTGKVKPLFGIREKNLLQQHMLLVPLLCVCVCQCAREQAQAGFPGLRCLSSVLAKKQMQLSMFAADALGSKPYANPSSLIRVSVNRTNDAGEGGEMSIDDI